MYFGKDGNLGYNFSSSNFIKRGRKLQKELIKRLRFSFKQYLPGAKTETNRHLEGKYSLNNDLMDYFHKLSQIHPLTENVISKIETFIGRKHNDQILKRILQ